MTKILKNASFWSALITIIYLIIQNWLGIEVPAWKDISLHLDTILSLVCGG